MRLTLLLGAPVAAAALVALAADARAFCRTTTSQIPAGYDPAVYGCWQDGTPIAWTAGQVPYSLSSAASRQVSLADATQVAHLAFDTWNNAPCEAGPPNVQMYDNGPVSPEEAATDCGLNQCDPSVHDNLHVIVFRDDVWPYNDQANTLALTTVTFGVDSAEIFDADMEINSAQHTLTVQEPPPTGQGEVYDLQAIMTHEAGHFHGLAHATSTDAIMYAYYKPGAILLTPDDIDGVCSIYSPLPVSSGCSCDVAGSSWHGALATAAASLGLPLLLIAYRWRTRAFRSRRRTH